MVIYPHVCIADSAGFSENRGNTPLTTMMLKKWEAKFRTKRDHIVRKIILGVFPC